MMGFRRLSNHGIRAALTTTQRVEKLKIFGSHRHDIPFLRLVTPDFQWRHTRLIAGNIPQLKLSATTAFLHQFSHGVRHTTAPHFIDEAALLRLAQLPAVVSRRLQTHVYLCLSVLDASET